MINCTMNVELLSFCHS